MKLEIVSHACCSVQTDKVRLVVDPWLNGSVYWGAWWHCPAPVFDDSIFQSDYVYLTHWHFDHMHEESLQLFDKSCHLLVPKFPVSIMAQELRKMGFTNVTELDHGKTLSLASDFKLTSFQVSYQDDSVCVIEADDVVIVDVNDAKPLPRAWKDLQQRFPHVDFMLRSHSPAWSYPSAYSFDRPEEAIAVTRDSYKSAFRSAVSMLKPRYAVPFASSVCHPHQQVLAENEDIISAFELQDYLDEHPLAVTALAIMPHGSSWSSDTGFSVDLEHAVRDAQAFVALHQQENRPWLEALAANEANITLKFDTFETFFRGFLGSLMMLVRPFLNIVFVFAIDDAGGEEFWCVNFRSGKITRQATEPANATSVMRVPQAVLQDALATFIFTNIDISKRWSVQVRAGGATKHLLGCVLISLFEAGYMTPRNLLSWRFIRGMFARRAEALDYLALSLKMLRSDPSAAARAITELD